MTSTSLSITNVDNIS